MDVPWTSRANATSRLREASPSAQARPAPWPADPADLPSFMWELPPAHPGAMRRHRWGMLSGVDPADLLTAFLSEGERIAWTVAGRDLTVPVPHCPGLDVGEVVRHLGSIYQRVTDWLHAQQPPASWQTAPTAGTDVRGWFATRLRALHDELAAHSAAQSCDTWFPADRSYRFWWRRMAHETTIHRMDVTEAYGLRYAVADAIAVDGIDEVLTLWLGTRLGTDVRGADQVVAIEAGTRVWRITLQPTAVDVAAEIPWECDAALSGPPEGVYRWLWGRGGLGPLRVTGDRTAVDTLREIMARATQSTTPVPPRR